MGGLEGVVRWNLDYGGHSRAGLLRERAEIIDLLEQWLRVVSEGAKRQGILRSSPKTKIEQDEERWSDEE